MDRIKRRLEEFEATLVSEELLEKALQDPALKFDYKCKDDHLNQKTVTAFQRSQICRVCSRCDPEDSKRRFSEVVKSNGWTTDLNKYKGTSANTEITCSCGKSWETQPCSVLRGGLCPGCENTTNRRKSISRQSSIDRLAKIVEERGGYVDISKYVDGNTKLLFTCADEHEWETMPRNVLGGSWCRDCLKTSTESFKTRLVKFVLDHGGNLDINEYVDTFTKMHFECRKGHRWETTPKIILQNFHCHECSPQRKKATTMEEFIQNLRTVTEEWGASFDNGKVNRSWMEFNCQGKHIWSANPNHILRGERCRGCQESDCQAALTEYVKKNGGVFDSTAFRGKNQSVLFTCIKEHQWKETPGTIMKDQTWCPDCKKIEQERVQMNANERAKRRAVGRENEKNEQEFKKKLEQKVKERGGTCDMHEYVDRSTKITFTCGAPHSWKAKPSLILANRWCGYCAGKSKTQTIQKLLDLVKQRRGTVDMSTYKSSNSLLRFTCHEAHPWLSRAYSILHQSAWCPTCRQSKGENQVASILNKANLSFLPQYPLKPTRLKADFFFESKNLIIEFDGEQHFTLEWAGRKKPENRVNDLRKNAWCVENNIHLLRIPWWTRDFEKIVLDAIAELSSESLLTPPDNYYGFAPPTDLPLDI